MLFQQSWWLLQGCFEEADAMFVDNDAPQVVDNTVANDATNVSSAFMSQDLEKQSWFFDSKSYSHSFLILKSKLIISQLKL